MNNLKLTLPKGSLEKATYEIFQGAFFKISGQERTYRPMINDSEIEVKILRPQEIPLYIASGDYDVGITGTDWILETDAPVKRLLDLEYGRVRIVSAIPKSVPFTTMNAFLEDSWKKGRAIRVSTEYLKLASSYLKSLRSYKKRFGNREPMIVTPWWRKGNNEKALIYLSFGATEAKPPEDAEFIIDVTETGSSLEQNSLRIVDTLLVSTAQMITNKRTLADPWKREKVYDLMALLKGVVEARKKVHIFVNVREKNLKRLLKALPALRRPTVSKLSEEGWYAINTVVEKKALREVIPTLRRLAQGLVVHEPQEVLPLDEIGKQGKQE